MLEPAPPGSCSRWADRPAPTVEPACWPRSAPYSSTNPGGPLPSSPAGPSDRIRSIDTSNLADLSHVDIVIASDVQNPLTGPNGAAAVYGPQKGATPANVDTLDTGLIHLIHYLTMAGHPDAAGTRHPRSRRGRRTRLRRAAPRRAHRLRRRLLLDLLDFETHLRGCDLVITGEGRMDDQTLNGKLPAIIARRAGTIPVIAVVGRSDITPAAQTTNGHRSRARHRRPHRRQPRRRPGPDQAAPRAARPNHPIAASPKHARSDSSHDQRHCLTTIRPLTRSRSVDISPGEHRGHPATEVLHRGHRTPRLQPGGEATGSVTDPTAAAS